MAHEGIAFEEIPTAVDPLKGVPMGTIIEIENAEFKVDELRGELAQIEGERAEEREETMRLRRKCATTASELDLMRSRLAVIGVTFPELSNLIDDLKAEGV